MLQKKELDSWLKKHKFKKIKGEHWTKSDGDYDLSFKTEFKQYEIFCAFSKLKHFTWLRFSIRSGYGGRLLNITLSLPASEDYLDLTMKYAKQWLIKETKK